MDIRAVDLEQRGPITSPLSLSRLGRRSYGGARFQPFNSQSILCPSRRCLHGLGPEIFSEDFKLVSEIHSRQRLRSASSTDVVVPATRRSSLFTWRPRISGRRSPGMDRVTALCHLGAVSFLLIPATSENISVPATTAWITVITVSWS